MPSSYTHEIYEGKSITLKQYILKCAQAFGGFAYMKDDSVSEPTHMPEMSDHGYHADAIQNAYKMLAVAESMTLKESAREIEEICSEIEEKNRRSYEKRKALKERYEDMIVKVEAWTPPTDEHKKIKDFAISQLRGSIEQDCRNMNKYLEPVERMSPEEWIQGRIDTCKEDIKYHEKKLQEQIDRHKSQVQWIDDLLDSFKNN